MRNTLLLLLCLLTVSLHAQTYNGGTGHINDFATTDFPLTVTGLVPSTIDTANFGLERVCINLTHTWDSDLDIYIVAPDGTTALLVSGQGGDQDNYTNTCFDQSAAQPITNGSAPFTGDWKPMGQMGLVNNGQNGNGVWTLRITDTYGADDGDVLGWSLTFGNNPASYFTVTESNLPIFVINTNGAGIPDEPRIPATLGVIWNGDGNRNYMSDPFNHYNSYVGIETRGASSSGFPKKSYDIELWSDAAGTDSVFPLCGMPPEADWVLSAQYTDKTLMRGMLTFHLYRQMGWWAPRTKPVEVFINGEYKGVYILMEKVKRDPNRIAVPSMDSLDIAGDELTGGYILKLDKNSGSSDPGWNSQYLPWPTGDSIYINFYYPDGNEIMPQQAAYIHAYVDSFETALYGPDFQDTTTGFRKYADVRSCVDALIIQEFTRSIDAYRKSFYFYKNRNSQGGKLIMAPIWDYDLSFGNAGFCEGERFFGWQYNFNYVCGGDGWLNPFWFPRMVADTLFERQVRCRWDELRQTVLSNAAVDQWIDSVATFLDESQGYNFTVWPIQGVYVWPNYYIGQNYEEEVDTLKWWIHNRTAWIDNNLPGPQGSCNFTSTEEAAGIPPLKAYPNPFRDELMIEWEGTGEMPQIALMNALGQALPCQLQMQGINRIQLLPDGEFPDGVYLLQVSLGDRVQMLKVVKR